MDCTEARQLLDPHVDRELDPSAAQSIERHLGECLECAAARERLLMLRGAARELRAPAPPALAARIRSALRDDLDERRTHSLRLWRTLALAACLLAVASIATSILLRQHPMPSGLLADEIIDSHIRSLLGDHLLDVISSDQHTVKPWFSGKLDFSPDVRDFKEQGFPLLGGRVDYLDGRAVAALVYGHGKHRINAFTWPAARLPESASDQTHQGYHLIRWRDGEMAWCLVSDAAEPSLHELQSLLQHHPAPVSEPSP